MAFTEENTVDMTSDGQSPWMKLNDHNRIVSLDCVDSNGETAPWGGVQAKPFFSPDGKMKSELASVTDGHSTLAKPRGFVAVVAEGFDGERLRIRLEGDRAGPALDERWESLACA
jgi:hypothetical protein